MNKVRANALKGFTLVELLVGIIISVLVGGLLLGIMVSNTGLFYKQSAKVTQGVGANEATGSIVSHIKQASGVDSSSNNGQLVLKLPSNDLNGDSILNTFDTVSFSKDTDKIRITVTPNALSKRKAEGRILTANVVNLEFKYFKAGAEVAPGSATKVSVTVTLEQKTGTSIQTDTSFSEAELRND
jgi:type II secretory pathway pseudopilin PulG